LGGFVWCRYANTFTCSPFSFAAHERRRSRDVGRHNSEPCRNEYWRTKAMKTFKVTEKWLREKQACPSGVEWFLNHKFFLVVPLVKALIKDLKFD
jgi:hypothetical protein